MDELSFWFREVPDAVRFPALTGGKQTDVIIIGGGIAGLSAAYFLSKAGIKTVLLEANTIGTGDSGYTTAFATHFLDTPKATLSAWDASESALNLLQEIITAEKIDCDWQQVDGIGFTQSEDKILQENFLKTVTKLQTCDPTIELLTDDKATQAVGFPVTAAYRKQGSEGQFHMRKFLNTLAERLKKNGTLLFEKSAVTDIKRGDVVTVRTAGGSVTAPFLIMATGKPPQQFFPRVTEQLTTAISYVIDVECKNEKLFPRALFWDDLEPFHYFRWVGANEFLLGGADWQMNKPKPTTNPHSQLEAWLKNITQNNVADIRNRWQGTLFYTANLMPFVDSHPAYGKNIIFLTGWGGNGTTLGFLAGSLSTDLIQRKKNKFEKLFSFTNRS